MQGWLVFLLNIFNNLPRSTRKNTPRVLLIQQEIPTKDMDGTQRNGTWKPGTISTPRWELIRITWNSYHSSSFQLQSPAFTSLSQLLHSLLALGSVTWCTCAAIPPPQAAWGSKLWGPWAASWDCSASWETSSAHSGPPSKSSSTEVRRWHRRTV